MALNPDCVGKTTKEFLHRYDWRDTVLYALGIGAKRSELDFLYEARGPKVFPSYSVIPGYTAHSVLWDTIGGDYLGVVHLGQGLRMYKPFPIAGTLRTTARVDGIYDLKRMAQSVVTARTLDETGELIAETEWSILYRFDGGFGGPPPPRAARYRPPERAPDFRHEDTTSPEQAILYRLNGDLNPLHIDPETSHKAGFDQPILHGLSTYGFVCRAVIHRVASGEPSKLKSFAGQFRKPVWPGDTLVTEGWEQDGKWLLRAHTKERPDEHVFVSACAELY